MAGGINLTESFAKFIDKSFYPQCKARRALGTTGFKFTDDRIVKIYSVPSSPLNDYSRSGANRYGNPSDLARNIQVEAITQDKSFAFTHDKGDDIQSEHLIKIGEAVKEELLRVVEPEFDRYCFKKWADTAVANGGSSTAAISKSNAMASFQAGVEWLENHNVEINDCVAFVSHRFATLIQQDGNFIRYGDRAQEILEKNLLGNICGVDILGISPSLLPAGAAFLIVNKYCSVSPVQLYETKITYDPPGISGTLVEGRILYDCFVFNNKATAIYYHGGQSVIKPMNIETAATDISKTTIIIHTPKEATANKWYYVTAASHAALPTLTFGTAITPGTSPWDTAVQLTANATEITPTSGHKRVLVVEVDSANKPVSSAEALINVGS